MDPTDPWGTLGAHVVAAKGARGARVGGGVSVRSLLRANLSRRRGTTVFGRKERTKEATRRQ